MSPPNDLNQPSGFGQPQWSVPSSPTTAWLTAVGFGNSLFVAVGDGGTIFTSPDGYVWTARTSGVSQRLDGIAYGGGIFLAIGEGGVALTSPDGIKWTVHTTGVSGWLRGIAYANGQFVVTGQGGTILTTPDGVVFTARTSGTANDLEAVIFDGSEFFAVGPSLTESVSTDGAHWAASSNPAYVPYDFRGAGFLNGVHLAAGDAGQIVSDQGVVTWSGTPPTANWRCLALGQATVVAVGSGGATAFSVQDGVTALYGLNVTATLGSSGNGPALNSSAPFVGSQITLSATLQSGSQPTYQWFLNGNPIAGATGPTFTLSNLSPTQIGTYSVTATNSSASVSSGYALAEIDPGPASPNLIDPTFQPPALSSVPAVVVPLPDGRIYLATGSGGLNGSQPACAARLLADGSVDPAFAPVAGSWTAIVPQPDGKIILFGSGALQRVTADGAPDAAFTPDPSLANSLLPPIVLTNGQLLGFSLSGSPSVLMVNRFSNEGSVDTSFAPFTLKAYGGPTDLVTSDAIGRLYVTTDYNDITRLNPDGTADPSFSFLAPVFSHLTAMQAVPTGLIYYATGFVGHGIATFQMQRLLFPTGAPDPSYPTLGTFSTHPTTVSRAVGFSVDGSTYATVRDGSGIVSSNYRNGIVRLDPSGNIDLNFWAELGPGVADVSNIFPLANGQLLVSGSFNVINGVPRSCLARLTPDRTAYVTRIANLSLRAFAGGNAQTLIAGFVTRGGPKNLLLRGAGPALAPFGVSGSLADPQISLISGQQTVAGNDNWSSDPDAGVIATTAADFGAFPFPANSLDSALLVTEPAGPYSVELTGSSGTTGVALAEIYDADPPPAGLSSPRLVNLSGRAATGAGNQTLIAGFVIEGNDTRTLLIRGVGPGLAPFGVTGVLADPVMTIYQGSTPIAMLHGSNFSSVYDENYDAHFVGAFNLSVGDCSTFITLAPGAYTAEVTSASGRSGVALLEIYEVP